MVVSLVPPPRFVRAAHVRNSTPGKAPDPEFAYALANVDASEDATIAGPAAVKIARLNTGRIIHSREVPFSGFDLTALNADALMGIHRVSTPRSWWFSKGACPLWSPPRLSNPSPVRSANPEWIAQAPPPVRPLTTRLPMSLGSR